METISGFLSECPWIIDVILRYHLSDVHGHAVEVLFDAIEGQHEDVSYRMLGKIVRRIRRHPDEFTKQSCFVEIGMKRCADRLQRFFPDDDRDVYDVWIPHALQMAALPLIDQKFSSYVEQVKESHTIISKSLQKTSRLLLHVDSLTHLAGVEDGMGGLDLAKTRLRLQSIMAMIEMDIQLIVGTSKLFDKEDRPKPGDESWNTMQELIGNLLTIRWELDQFSMAIGSLEDFRVHIHWDMSLGIDLIPFLVNYREHLLRMTPPQIILALELLNISIHQGCQKENKNIHIDDDFVASFSVLRSMVQASIEGIFHPKDVVSAAATQKFANLAQRLRVSLSKDDRFKSILAQKEASATDEGVTVAEESVSNILDKKKDDVSHFLSLIGSSKVEPSPTKSAKKAKRIVAQRIGDNIVKKGDVKIKEEHADETFVAPYHHKGRVIMPATYNLDSDAREALWQAYMEDKDKLVEMLGDSNYHEWHDESQVRSRRRKSGIDNAFDAVFGASIAKVEMPGAVSKDGKLAEDTGKSLLESSLIFPWQSLLSSVLGYTIHVVRAFNDRKDELFGIIINEEMALCSVNASLKMMHPDYSRPLWKSCCDIVSENRMLGSLLYLAYQLKRVVMSTTRHTMERLLSSFLEMMSIAISQGPFPTADFKLQTKYSTNPLTMVERLVRSCMTFPPLLGSSINSAAAKFLPKLCGLGMDTEVIVYMSSCCYTIWQSMKGSKGSIFWLSDEYDFSTHPVCSANALSKCEFVTHGLEVISKNIQRIDEDSFDIISALLASSSLCASIAVEICKVLSSNNRGVKSRSTFSLICGQKNLNLNLLSVMSALCEIYCGLAEDWEEFLLQSVAPDASSIPHAGSIAFGFDFTDGCIAYFATMRQSLSIHKISDPVLERLELIILETKKKLEIISNTIQNLDKETDLYKTIIQEIRDAPEIIVLDVNVSASSSKFHVNGAKRGKRMKDISNPFVKAILQEAGKKDEDYVEDDLSDLEDFIVANPETDYVEFIDQHFPLDNSQDSE